ncbi:SdiA-regulated domain-containing protein [Stutzerimonas kirkiae]|uniref:DNA-binding protein n=1 Tax=Stutzerimonas kirkiae TaxID=2211392 RepID=A0A4Q9REM1_9GAMM|nr:SdiA-regulated domain-containing protein [Stutzerimonas kirkiae]TBU99279.1 DNA-binding protein [Stutzerimonas kirkiae]TBV06261.1 DNA-binding protein [Stutzerimonas kirkiae]TBV08005.1 DNA-binding protein [Stutzerimonas kirkiae]TBV15847.1 DNA-binding protein [Stutzerimonas kirkiae]
MRRIAVRVGLLGMCAVLATAVIYLGQQHRAFERLWLGTRQSIAPLSDDSIRLADYRVVIEGHRLEGIDQVSALTFDPDRNSLFTVTNRNPELIELSLYGDVLRRIPLVGLEDPEAVEYVGLNRYVIADERRQKLVRVQLDDDTLKLDVSHLPMLDLSRREVGNKGFEGLAYDIAGQRLFVGQERDPMRIIEVHGYSGGPFNDALSMELDEMRDRSLLMRDLSSLQFDERTGHLLALSDESRVLLELDRQGRALGTLSLLMGQHGLKQSIPQAEGVTMGSDGAIYMVSEPNLFYVFRKPDSVSEPITAQPTGS